MTTDHLYLTSQPTAGNTPGDTSKDTAMNVEDILNEKVFNELMSKYTVETPTIMEEQKKPVTPSATSENTKDSEKSIKRIITYNNKRSYDERLGFVTNLSDKADQLGVSLTIKHLLPIITKYIVVF